MNTETIQLIIQGIEAAISAAPQFEEVVTKAKEFISSLTSAGLITKAVQDALHARVDIVCAAALAGDVPPEFTVEPDPQ
jgi:hypothetical protein